MANTTSPLLPATEDLLKAFGERLRIARLRRRLQAREVAQRAGMTEVTLRRVERGLPGVTMGAYLAVMQVLQLQDDVTKWALEDTQGRHLQDAQLQQRIRPRRLSRPANAARSVAALDNQEWAKPMHAIDLNKDEGERPKAAVGSVSATDLLKAIHLPVVTPSSGKNKA